MLSMLDIFMYNSPYQVIFRIPVLSCTVQQNLFLSGHSKIYKTKVLRTVGSLLQVESIAEWSTGAFCNTFDLH